MVRDHGHLDLPRHERRAAGRGAGDVGAVLGGITPGCGASRRARAASATSSAGSSTTSSAAATTRRPSARGTSLHAHLSELAAEQEVGEHGLRRARLGERQPLGAGRPRPQRRDRRAHAGTRPPDVYRALVEATAFGARRSSRRSRRRRAGRRLRRSPGGLLKNQFVMQIYADVLRRPLHLIGSDQGPALGSAIHAAVAAGAHPTSAPRAAAMGKLERDAYAPDARAADAYDELLRRLPPARTTTSAAMTTTSCTGCGGRRKSSSIERGRPPARHRRRPACRRARARAGTRREPRPRRGGRPLRLRPALVRGGRDRRRAARQPARDRPRVRGRGRGRAARRAPRRGRPGAALRPLRALPGGPPEPLPERRLRRPRRLRRRPARVPDLADRGAAPAAGLDGRRGRRDARAAGRGDPRLRPRPRARSAPTSRSSAAARSGCC